MADMPLGNREGVSAFLGIPLERLHSWNPKNLTWGHEEEPEALQERVKFFADQGVTLIDVIHGMLHRRVQPLQARVSPLWMFVITGNKTSVIRGFYNRKDLGRIDLTPHLSHVNVHPFLRQRADQTTRHKPVKTRADLGSPIVPISASRLSPLASIPNGRRHHHRRAFPP